MPEAYSESMEILQEIERVRPDWLRDAPDVQFFNRLKNDWTRRTGGFWARCARSPESEARFLSDVEGEMIEGARVKAQLAREEMINSEWKRNPPMDKTLAGFHWQIPGWRGEMVEAWRWDSLIGFTYGLGRQGNAYRDWIAPIVELDDGLLASAPWVEFWLHLSDKRAMPRTRNAKTVDAMGTFLRPALSEGNPWFSRRHPAFHILPRYGCSDHGG
jgi:hypothetical protein